MQDKDIRKKVHDLEMTTKYSNDLKKRTLRGGGEKKMLGSRRDTALPTIQFESSLRIRLFVALLPSTLQSIAILIV